MKQNNSIYYCKKTKTLSVGNKVNLFVEVGREYELHKVEPIFGRNVTFCKRWPYAIHANSSDGFNRWFVLTEFQFRSYFCTKQELRKEKLKRLKNI